MSKTLFAAGLVLMLCGVIVTGFGVVAALVLGSRWAVWVGLGMVGAGVPSWLAGAGGVGAAAHHDAQAAVNRLLYGGVRRGRR